MYAGIVGFVTFPLFMIEEAIQMATWGTWAAKEAKSAEAQLQGIEVIEKLNRSLKFINTFFGWVQPLSLIGYDHYGRATDYYIEAVKTKLVMQDPEAFNGRIVEFTFVPKQYFQNPDGTWTLTNGKIFVQVPQEPDLGEIRVKGILRALEGKIVLEIVSK